MPLHPRIDAVGRSLRPAEHQRAAGSQHTPGFIDDAPPAGIPVGESHGELPQGGGSGYAFHVNLIPWNPVYGLQYQRPDRERVAAFVQGLRARGIPTTVRLERGVDIDAACGQLQRTHGAPDLVAPGSKGTREQGNDSRSAIAKHSG